MACLFPFFVDDIPVPCGKCPACLVRRTDAWIFRILQEEKTARSSHFLTLTYDDLHLPRSSNNLPTLSKRDVQLFIKRLRKSQVCYERKNALPHRKITYYCAGEYGTRRQRPHYHLIILNSFDHLYESAWHDNEGTIIGASYVDPRRLSSSAIGYTVGYMNKKRIVPVHKRDDRIPEFSLMSKKLGLGYLSDAVIAYHRADFNRSYVTLPGGRRTALPRYYADRIYNYSVVADRASIKELRAPYLDKSVRDLARRAYDRHIELYGSPDDFIRSEASARYASIVNFQNRSLLRKDF